MKLIIRILTLIVLVFLGSKENLGDVYFPPEENVPFESILVVKHTWHTGIILNRGQISNHFSKMDDVFPKSSFLEIGWGDYDFFRSEKATSGMAVKAMLWPTKSVLHAYPYYKDPSYYFTDEQIIEIQLTKQGLINVLNYVNQSFDLDKNGEIILLESDIEVAGQFFLSEEKYHLFKTCNVWTARAIKTSGYPIHPFYALSAKNLMKQLRKLPNN